MNFEYLDIFWLVLFQRYKLWGISRCKLRPISQDKVGGV